MNQIQITAEFFPTAKQRRTLAATDAELAGLIRRQADPEGFVELEVLSLARRLHAWPEVGTDLTAQIEFVRERIETFVKFGLLRRVKKTIHGRLVCGYILTQLKNNPSQDGSTTSLLTTKDRDFLRRLKIFSW